MSLQSLAEQVSALADRVDRLERTVSALRASKTSAKLTLYGATHPDGRRKNQRFAKCWYDVPVRAEIIDLHRTMPIRKAVAELEAKFGKERAPSASALQRIWKQLDFVNERLAFQGR